MDHLPFSLATAAIGSRGKKRSRRVSKLNSFSYFQSSSVSSRQNLSISPSDSALTGYFSESPDPQVEYLKTVLSESDLRLSKLENNVKRRETKPSTALTQIELGSLESFGREGIIRPLTMPSALSPACNRNASPSTSTCGDDEVENFLKNFKKEHKQNPSATKIQSWWRMLFIRRRYRKVKSREFRTKKNVMFGWSVIIKANRIRNIFFRRRFFCLWVEYTEEEKHVRDIAKKLFSKANKQGMEVPGCLTNLFLKAEMLGLKRKFMEKMKDKAKREETAKTEAAAYTGDPNYDKDLGEIIQANIKRKGMHGWKLYRQLMIRNRQNAGFCLHRAVCIGQNLMIKPLWLKERVVLIFKIWRRWSHFKNLIRKGLPEEQYDEVIDHWDRLVVAYHERRSLKEKAKRIGPKVRLRRNFRFWSVRTVEIVRERENEKAAIEQYLHSRKYWIVKKWVKASKERGGNIRLTRRCLLSWRIWAERKARMNSIKAYIKKTILRTSKRKALKKWIVNKQGSVAKRTKTIRFLISNPNREAFKALYVFMAWTGNITTFCFLSCWSHWREICIRRRNWRKFQLSYFQQKNAHTLQTVWNAWNKRETNSEFTFSWTKMKDVDNFSSSESESLKKILLSGDKRCSALQETTTNYAEKSSNESFLEALHLGDKEKVLHCVQNGIDITWKDKKGRSYLHLAASYYNNRYIPIVLYLIQAGIPVTLCDNENRIPADTAVNPIIRSILIKHYKRVVRQQYTVEEKEWYRRSTISKFWEEQDLNQILRLMIKAQIDYNIERKSNGNIGRRFFSVDDITRIKVSDSFNTETNNNAEDLTKLDKMHQAIIKQRRKAFVKRSQRDKELIRRWRIRENVKHYTMRWLTRDMENVDMSVYELPPLELGTWETMTSATFNTGENSSIVELETPISKETDSTFAVSQIPKSTNVITFNTEELLRNFEGEEKTMEGYKQEEDALRLSLEQANMSLDIQQKVRKLWKDSFEGFQSYISLVENTAKTLQTNLIQIDNHIIKSEQFQKKSSFNVNKLKRDRRDEALKASEIANSLAEKKSISAEERKVIEKKIQNNAKKTSSLEKDLARMKAQGEGRNKVRENFLEKELEGAKKKLNKSQQSLEKFIEEERKNEEKEHEACNVSMINIHSCVQNLKALNAAVKLNKKVLLSKRKAKKQTKKDRDEVSDFLTQLKVKAEKAKIMACEPCYSDEDERTAVVQENSEKVASLALPEEKEVVNSLIPLSSNEEAKEVNSTGGTVITEEPKAEGKKGMIFADSQIEDIGGWTENRNDDDDDAEKDSIEAFVDQEKEQDLNGAIEDAPEIPKEIPQEVKEEKSEKENIDDDGLEITVDHNTVKEDESATKDEDHTDIINRTSSKLEMLLESKNSRRKSVYVPPKRKRRLVSLDQDPVLELSFPLQEDDPSYKEVVQKVLESENENSVKFQMKTSIVVTRDHRNFEINESETKNRLQNISDLSKRLIYSGGVLRGEEEAKIEIEKQKEEAKRKAEEDKRAKNQAEIDKILQSGTDDLDIEQGNEDSGEVSSESDCEDENIWFSNFINHNERSSRKTASEIKNESNETAEETDIWKESKGFESMSVSLVRINRRKSVTGRPDQSIDPFFSMAQKTEGLLHIIYADEKPESETESEHEDDEPCLISREPSEQNQAGVDEVEHQKSEYLDETSYGLTEYERDFDQPPPKFVDFDVPDTDDIDTYGSSSSSDSSEDSESEIDLSYDKEEILLPLYEEGLLQKPVTDANIGVQQVLLTQDPKVEKQYGDQVVSVEDERQERLRVKVESKVKASKELLQQGREYWHELGLSQMKQEKESNQTINLSISSTCNESLHSISNSEEADSHHIVFEPFAVGPIEAYLKVKKKKKKMYKSLIDPGTDNQKSDINLEIKSSYVPGFKPKQNMPRSWSETGLTLSKKTAHLQPLFRTESAGVLHPDDFIKSVEKVEWLGKQPKKIVKAKKKARPKSQNFAFRGYQGLTLCAPKHEHLEVFGTNEYGYLEGEQSTRPQSCEVERREKIWREFSKNKMDTTNMRAYSELYPELYS